MRSHEVTMPAHAPGPAHPAGAPHASTASSILRLAPFVVATMVVVLGGGSNRTDVLSLVYVRPVLVLCLMAMAVTANRRALAPVAWPLIVLGLSFALAIVQLVPLPPAVWTGLPGRALMMRVAQAEGVAQPWRPLTLTPDLTIQAALWFLAPACALLGWATLPRHRRTTTLGLVLLIVLASGVLGGLQVSQGSGSFLYLYRQTYEGNAVGFLANRNHQAALLASAFPMLRAWTLLPVGSERARRMRLVAAASAMLLLVPMILLTASRAGLALSVVGFAMAIGIAPLTDIQTMGGRVGRYVPVALTLAIVAATLGVALSGRSLAMSRLFGTRIGDDLRIQNLPQVLHVLGTYFPVGSGLGSFDPVYRIQEPDASLISTTFNHAHNDFLEVILTGGLPGLILLVAGLCWWLASGWTVWRRRATRSTSLLLARTGWSFILIFVLASTVDYPTRTPLLGFLLALAAGWLASGCAALRSSALQGPDG